MPYFCHKPHHRRLERVFIRYLNIHLECASFIWCSWRTVEGALQFGDAVSDRLDINVGNGIGLNVCKLFSDTSGSVPGHREEGRWGSRRVDALVVSWVLVDPDSIRATIQCLGDGIGAFRGQQCLYLRVSR